MVLIWKPDIRNQKDQKTQYKKNEAILDFVSRRLLHLTAYLSGQQWITWAHVSSGDVALTPKRTGMSKVYTANFSKAWMTAGAKWEPCPNPGSPTISILGRKDIGWQQAFLKEMSNNLCFRKKSSNFSPNYQLWTFISQKFWQYGQSILAAWFMWFLETIELYRFLGILYSF